MELWNNSQILLQLQNYPSSFEQNEITQYEIMSKAMMFHKKKCHCNGLMFMPKLNQARKYVAVLRDDQHFKFKTYLVINLHNSIAILKSSFNF